MKQAGGISFGDSVKDFARKCKGKQGRARLAAAVGILAMLLILLSELFRRTRQRAAQKHKVCPEQHGISGTAGEPAGTSDLTDERCGQNDRDGHAGDWGRSHLCAGYTVRRNAVPADPCPAEDGSALTETVCLPQVCGVAVLCEGGGDIRVAARITELVSALLDLPSNRICVEQRKAETLQLL